MPYRHFGTIKLQVGYFALESLKVSEISDKVIIEIWNKNPHENLPFKKLKSLEVFNYSNWRYLLTPSMAMGLIQLQDLKVTNCVTMEHVIIGDGAEEVFPQLNSILLESCSNLSSFYKGSSILKFPSLMQITVVDCPAMVAFASGFSEEQNNETGISDGGGNELMRDIPIQPFFSNKVEFLNLESLRLSTKIIIQKIWHNQVPEITFLVQNLTVFIVEGLCNLKYLLTSSMIKSFKQLTRLKIRDCKMMEGVIVTEGLANEEMMLEIFFPKLNILRLEDLPKLTGIYFGNYSGISYITMLVIIKCPVLRTFISSSTLGDTIASPRASKKVENTSAPSLFNTKVSFPILATLAIGHLGTLNKLWHDQVEADSFCQLKQIVVGSCETLRYIFPFNMLQKLQGLKQVTVVDCDSLEAIFEPHLHCVQKLQHDKVPEMPSFFRNLEDLTVMGCSNLRYLLSSFMVKSFEHLKSLNIQNCKMIVNA